MRLSVILVACIAGCLAIGGCAGPIAKTGCGRITALSPHGVMALQYEDGTVATKRIDPAFCPEGIEIAAENLLKPARYVETDQGSTLSFSCDETITYYNMGCD